MVLSAPLIAKLSRKIDPRLLIAAGLSLFAFSLWRMTPITSDWTGHELFWPQFLRGFSILLCIVPATNMALGSVPPERLKMVSALFNTMRNLGGAIGIACINTWLNSGTNLHWLRLSEGLLIGTPELDTWLTHVTAHMQEAIADPAIATDRAIAVLAHLTRREAATMAFSDTLWIMSVPSHSHFCAACVTDLLWSRLAPSVGDPRLWSTRSRFTSFPRTWTGLAGRLIKGTRGSTRRGF
jgi:DHA2 family multidrug resistance protein